jgi:cytochrome P450
MSQGSSLAENGVAGMAAGTRPLGTIEILRRTRVDPLSVLRPESFGLDIAETRLLFLRFVTLNRPDYIEHVLLNNHRNYRKSDIQRNAARQLIGNGLVTSDGALWQRQRRIMAPAFHRRRIAQFVAVMVERAAAMRESWAGRTEPFDITADMRGLTLDIITRTMFSTDISGEASIVRRLMDIVLARKPSLLDLLGLPAWLPRPEGRVHRQVVAAFDDMVARLLAERRREGAADCGDLLAMLLAARDPETGESMSDRQLHDEIITIFIAGHETTATALSWTWYLLATHPEAEAALHAEIDRVLDGRLPGFADLAELKWTRMVVEEAMRLYPPAHTILRTAVGEDRIGEVRVPPGAIIVIRPYVTHRNPKLWPQPERFDPMRFSPEAVAQRHRFAYLPFGGGPRICIGNGFALVEAQIILATMAQRYRLRLAPGHAVQPIGLGTLRAKDGIWVTLEPRGAIGGGWPKKQEGSRDG